MQFIRLEHNLLKLYGCADTRSVWDQVQKSSSDIRLWWHTVCLRSGSEFLFNHTAVMTHGLFEIRFRSPPQLYGYADTRSVWDQFRGPPQPYGCADTRSVWDLFRCPPQPYSCADTWSVWDQVRTVPLNYTSETARVSPPEVRYIYPKFWRSLPRKRIGDYTKKHDRRISMTKTSLLFARPVFDHFSRWHLHHTPANILRLYISANSYPTQFKMWAVIKYVNTCVMFSHYQLVDMDHPAK